MLVIDLINKQVIPYMIGIFVVCSCIYVLFEYLDNTQVYASKIMDETNIMYLESDTLQQLIGVDNKPYIVNNVIRMKKGNYIDFNYYTLVDVYKYDGTKLSNDSIVYINKITNKDINVIYIRASDNEGYTSILKLVVILEGIDNGEYITTYDEGKT